MSTTTRSSWSGRPGSEILCSLPTDPTGFIYSSYRAAPAESYRDKPPPSGSHQDVAYLFYSVGGPVSTLSFEDIKTSNQLSSHKRRGRSIREGKGFL